MNNKVVIMVALVLILGLSLVSWKTGNASREDAFFATSEELLVKPFLGSAPLVNIAIVGSVIGIVVLMVVWRRGLGG